MQCRAEKSREKKGGIDPLDAGPKDPLKLMLFPCRNSVVAHEPSVSNIGCRAVRVCGCTYVLYVYICSDPSEEATMAKTEIE